MSTVLKRSLAAAVPCLLLLSGCGVAETQFHPGVAVEVGDRTITNDRVDQLTSGFCAAVEEQIVSGGQAYPMRLFERGIVGQLAMRSATEQLAADYDVEPGADYQAQLAQIETEAEGLSKSGREEYVEVQSTVPYVTDVLTQIGDLLLEEEGEDDPTLDFQQARGLDALAEWMEREGVTFDPRYGTEIVDGQPQPVDTDLTFAVSDVAKGGVSEEDPDPLYVASLPDSATCG
jgi:peptidyl-prolyl cis-trans isomerase SurA